MKKMTHTYIFAFSPSCTKDRELVIEGLLARGFRDCMFSLGLYIIVNTNKGENIVKEAIPEEAKGQFTLWEEMKCDKDGTHLKKMWKMLDVSNAHEETRSEAQEGHFEGVGSLSSE